MSVCDYMMHLLKTNSIFLLDWHQYCSSIRWVIMNAKYKTNLVKKLNI